MAELDKGCSLIAEAAKDNRRAAKALVRLIVDLMSIAIHTFPQLQVILNRMREKARRAMAAARADGGAAAWGGIKEEEKDDEFTVYAGRTKVFRPGATSSPSPVPPQTHGMMELSPDEAQAHAQDHAAQAPAQPSQSMLGEWLERQEQYVGFDPHFVAPIVRAPTHTPQHQHQHQQYGYATPEPQYTLDAVQPPLPQYMTASYQYPPPPQGPLSHPQPQPQPQPQSQAPSPSSALGGLPHHAPPNGPLPHPHPHQYQHQHQHPQVLSHHPHQHHQQGQEDLELRRTYTAAAAFAPPELSQLGLVANGSRVSETWMSFMHTGMLEGGGAVAGPGGRRM